MSSCPHVDRVRALPRDAKVYKDECSQCFTDWDSANGVNICLTCFNTGCPEMHSPAHCVQAGHPVAVNVKRVEKKKDNQGPPPPKMTKLAIAAESDAEKHDVVTKAQCQECQVDLSDHEQIKSIVNDVLRATTASMQNEVKAWELEIEPCEHTLCLEQPGAPLKLDSTLAHCGSCDLRENLWLCLTCGNLGCGRQQFGGLPGNSHGLAHAEATGKTHPVAVKLGTITPDGGADVYCYGCNEERKDPYLAEHLAHFGINLAATTKTEKSLVEMQIEQNLQFDFSMTTADGHALVPVSGPGLTGLKNLGNSCYVSSVMQCLAHVPEFAARFDPQRGAAAHVQSCGAAHAQCWECQWAKLVGAIVAGDRAAVTPTQFKHLVAAGHPEFATMRQQDASEFLDYLLKKIMQADRKYAIQSGPGPSEIDPSRAFRFVQTQRLKCTECGGVRYSENEASVLNLIMPERTLKAALAQATQESEGKSVPPVEADALTCLKQMMETTVEFNCPRCAKKVQAVKTNGFKTFPKVLAVVAQRFVYDNWVPKKSNVHVKWPAAGAIDLRPLQVARGADEVALPDDAPSGGGGGGASAAPAADSPELSQLIEFGFPRNQCRKALAQTGSNIEAAMNWIMDHPDDMGEDEPPAAAAAPAVDEGAVSMLMDMGFARAQAARGLRETGGNVERAVEWLFSHPDVTGDEPGAGADSGSGAAAAAAAPAALPALDSADSAEFAMASFINHKGPSMHCGHYINHIATPQGGWVMMNDERVVAQPDPRPLMEEAYVYFFRRTD